MTHAPMALGIAIAASLVAMGIAGGVAIERIRFGSERAAMLQQYERDIRVWHERAASIGLGDRSAGPAARGRREANRLASPSS